MTKLEQQFNRDQALALDVENKALMAEIASLRAALKGIAEYCSTDGDSPLGAIARLVAVRNTAERALVATFEQNVGENNGG